MAKSVSKNKNIGEGSTAKTPPGDRKSHPIPDKDVQLLKMIATRARTLRRRKNLSSDEFARLADINHNTYYRFERSETTGDNYTMGLVIKVIRGLNISIQEFFEGIK